MNRELLIVDDNAPFRIRLSKSMEKKGFVVESFQIQNKPKEELQKKNLISQ